jgi:hypothetical protein
MTVSVGIGTGSKMQQAAFLMQLLGVQKEAIQLQGGANGPLVTLENVYHTIRKLIENAGLRTPDPYITEPSNAPQVAPPQHPPDPRLIEAQQKPGIEQMRIAAQQQTDTRRAIIQALTDIEVASINSGRQADTAAFEAKLEMLLGIHQAHVQAAADVLGAHANAAAQMHGNAMNAAAQVQQAALQPPQPTGGAE